jgi:hypothetical protein
MPRPTVENVTASAGALVTSQQLVGPTYMTCHTDSTCIWGNGVPVGPNEVEINMLATVPAGAPASGAAMSTIGSAPFHGLCFVEPGGTTPLWCEAIAPVGQVVQDEETTQEINTFVELGQNLAGSPAYEYELCYLPGTLATGASAGCVDMGGYCCFAPRSIGKPDPGNPDFGFAPGGYFFAFHSMPDLSTAGPVPFATWASNGDTTIQP